MNLDGTDTFPVNNKCTSVNITSQFKPTYRLLDSDFSHMDLILHINVLHVIYIYIYLEFDVI